MGIVLDSSAVIDLNTLDESLPLYRSLEAKTSDACYMTPLDAAEVYYRLNKDVDTRLADMVMEAMKRGYGPKIVECLDLVELTAEARTYGVPPNIALTAALARKLDTPVLVAQSLPDRVAQYRRLEGFCWVEVY